MTRRRFAGIALVPRGRWGWLRAAILAVATLAAVGGGVSCMIAMPGTSHTGPLPELTDAQRAVATRLESTVVALADTIGERNVWRPEGLERSALWVEDAFRQAGYEVTRQEFDVGEHTVRNIAAEIAGGERADEIVVIGAHYDSAPGTPGANDNATGVSALVELARDLKDSKPSRTIRFVAFVNEEPPFFQTDDMGSLRYARACRESGDTITAMLSLETIGYYTDEPRTQHYPPFFSWFYPDCGNFITFVGNMGSRSLVRRCVGRFRDEAAFPSEGASPPGWITGVGWSDQWAFWQIGVPAIMVTDTAPFRYPHYHQPTDTPDKIDYERLARVVDGLAAVVGDLAD